MKIRNGFISNSSSCSFVVAFPHKPKSIEDLKEMMFGKQEWHYAGIYGETEDTSVMPIVKAVFDIIKDKGKATKEEIFESISSGWFDPYMIEELFPGHYEGKSTAHLSYQNEKDRKKIENIWKEQEEINNKRASNIAKAFIDGHKNEFLAVMEFCDNDGSFWSMMEHSGIFKRIDHIKTSYH